MLGKKKIPGLGRDFLFQTTYTREQERMDDVNDEKKNGNNIEWSPLSAIVVF